MHDIDQEYEDFEMKLERKKKEITKNYININKKIKDLLSGNEAYYVNIENMSFDEKRKCISNLSKLKVKLVEIQKNAQCLFKEEKDFTISFLERQRFSRKMVKIFKTIKERKHQIDKEISK